MTKPKTDFQRGNLRACVDAGVVNTTQLAECLGIAQGTVAHFCKKGLLRYTISQQTHYLYTVLRHFAKWAVTSIGSKMLAKALKQDEKAIAWVMEIIGKWLWIG